MWKDLNITQKNELMKLFISEGITNLSEMKRLYDNRHVTTKEGSNKYAYGSSLLTTPDYDPTNPYHVHTEQGEKVVIEPEQYEKHKEQPYFANIRKQVEEHQAAYPGPEYTETPNPEYRKVYANVRAASNQHFKEHNINGKTYREYSTPPESYIRNSATGVVTDEQGNLYRPMTQADAGKGVTPIFTTTERDYHNGRDFDMSWVRVKTPEKTIRTLKQPLPVDRTYNVDEDLNGILKTPYEYKLKVWENDWWVASLPEVLARRLQFARNKGSIKEEDDSTYTVPKSFYDDLKHDADKWNEVYEQNYLKSKYVTPIYPTKDYVNKNIQLNIKANGGPLFPNKKTVDKVNSSNADFVNRLKDPNREYIYDWANPDMIATHKLSVGTDEQGNTYIYPEVQNINGKLVDFTRPPYAPYAGMLSAESRGDTVRVSNIDEGVDFTEKYKMIYPKGRTFAEGGNLFYPGGELDKVQKAVSDKEQYAKYNVATQSWDEDGTVYNMNLPELRITADSPETEANKRVLLNHGYTQEDLNNPNIKAHLPALANMLRNYDINGINYLKGIGEVGLGLAGILTGGSGIGLAGVLGKEGIKQGAKKLGRKALRFGIDAGVGATTDYASNKAIQGLSNGEYEGFGDLMNRGVFNGSKDDVWKPMLWDMVNPLGIASDIGTDVLLNSNLGRSLVTSAMLNLSPNMRRQGNIIVGNNYFHAPDKWYRYIDSPEVGTIQELGMNVTTTDASGIPSQSNRFRTSLVNNSNWEHDKSGPKLFRKLGSAHGNQTQASAKQLWNGTIAGNNDLFKHGVLEGEIPENINVGINRRVFNTTPRENVNVGDRVGFPTGEMPIEGLRYFEHIPRTKKYKYEGEVLPYKTEYVVGQDNPFYLNAKQGINENNSIMSTTNNSNISTIDDRIAHMAAVNEIGDNINKYPQLNTTEDYQYLAKTFIPRFLGEDVTQVSDRQLDFAVNSFNRGVVPMHKVNKDAHTKYISGDQYKRIAGWYDKDRKHIVDLDLDNPAKIHEMTHAYRDLISTNNYPPKVRTAVKKDLDKVQDFFTKGKYTYDIDGKSFEKEEYYADMVGLRSKLFKTNNVQDLSLQDQNAYIDKLSDNYILQTFENISGYAGDFMKSFSGDRKELAKMIRESLKVLPAVGAGVVISNANTSK